MSILSKKISALPSASTLDGTEQFPLVQGGTTKKGLISQIAAFIGSAFVPTSRTVNAKALTSNIVLNTDDVQESGTPTNKWWTNARTITSVLTGFTGGAGTVTSSDTVLTALQKIVGNIGALVTGVSSVNTFTGAVNLTTANVPDSTDKRYQTDNQNTRNDATSSIQTQLNSKQTTITDVIWGAILAAFTGKTTPIDADMFDISDSADSNKAKKVTWDNIKATLKTYFDTIYTTKVLTTIGDFLYGGASGAATRLAGNTTTKKQYLSSIGNGTNSLVPTLRDFDADVNTSQLAVRGTLFSEAWANLTNWTAAGVGGTFAVSGGLLNIVSAQASLTLTDTLAQTNYGSSSLMLWDSGELPFTIPTISATTFGVGIGIKSTVTTNAYSITLGFLTDTANQGKIGVFYGNNTTPINTLANQGSLVIAGGNSTTIRVIRLFSRVIAIWKNGSKSFVFEYDITPYYGTSYIMPNAGNFCIRALGGNMSLGAITSWKSSTPTGANRILLCDSKGAGYYVTQLENAYFNLMNQLVGGTNIISGQAGNMITNANATEVASLLSSSSEIYIALGINDIITGGVNAATYLTRMQTLVSNLQTAAAALSTPITLTVGVNIFFVGLEPCNTVDVTNYNAQLIATYPTAYIPTYDSLRTTGTFTYNSAYSFDGLHGNQVANRIIADAIINFRNIPYANKPIPTTKTIWNQSFGNQNNSPLYPIDVASPSQGTSSRFGAADVDQGIYTMFFDSSNIHLGFNAALSGGSFIAKTANPAIFSYSTSGFAWYFDTGKTIAASYTATMIMKLQSTGLLFIGGSTTPTARVHLAASTTTASQLRVTMGGSAPSSPNAGDAWGSGTDLLSFYGKIAVRVGSASGNPSAKVGGVITNYITDVLSPANTSENDLYTVNIVGNILAVNGDRITYYYGLNLKSTGGTTKQIRAYFAGGLIFDSTAIAIATSTDMIIKVTVTRDSSTTVRATADASVTGTGSTGFAKVTKLTGLDLTISNVLKITATVGVGAVSGDVTAIVGQGKWDSAA